MTGLLDEISQLKGLVVAQQQQLQAQIAQYKTQKQQYEVQQQIIKTQAEQYEAQQQLLCKHQQDMLQMQKMLEIVMAKIGTSSQFSMPDTEYPPILVNAKSSVASRTGNNLTFTIIR